MKKIVITGGSGFIGSNLVEYFLKKKYFVVNIDKFSYSGNKYNSHNFNKKNYTLVRSDINNKKLILKTLRKYKPSIIFNLAAETHVDRSIDGPKPFIDSNINGVFNLLESIRFYNKKAKKKIKLIHISTDEVYGDILDKFKRADENYPYKPSSPYAASKASADHLIKSYVRTYNFPAIISNCSNNYGPKQFPEKLIPKLIFNILSNQPLPIYGKGLNSREWIYVEDHCRALDLLSTRGKVGETYNIGSGKNLSNIELTKLIIKIIKKKSIKVGKKVKIKFVKDRPGHDVRYALNSTKIKKKIKWKSLTDINNGLSKTIDWYINNTQYFKSISKKDHVKRIGLKI
ncbi:dTDP-glucose 4,6-dehydratase [Pelagibacteraceae bacterium]|jgi:dTDP-glucose 4,6-dehydratase|nr:dTDP-glucose 4,6-dehydratase [Pelagibacteraceae bacterium]